MTEEAQELQPLMAARKVAFASARLKEMAKQGGFAVDETTGQEMIRSLQGVIDSLEERWSALTKLQKSPPMSSTATARWVSEHMHGTATDAQGLLTQLQAARAEFPTYIEAIELAQRNYRERDAENQRDLKRIDTEI
ncbi:hypothetical protein AB0E55_17990 [Amycolatopsis keratiniphila]|uniref:PE domain-containing protein n=1 Tax=Amycolatopsis keratiniphila subsp. keratiniphila TaxID=227715 RepID=A0A1W2LRE2_9PSEU|nr:MULTISPECIES: hypothetical protein [Amycolatopsis]OLZ59637.1 hypothetical protein BS330_04455 [Amycolatopsis keratiniphila subsp. nogabecina]ONF66890.1 hypothetical protein AVR91_0223315 [Amycolatopsis keratiniphila subsp. keratiniphila]SDU54424.1 hypothetical protein SAMN04489733_5803 [Amycolatopsis keratiniphila]